MKLFWWVCQFLSFFFTPSKESLWPFEISLNQERTTLSPYV